MIRMAGVNITCVSEVEIIEVNTCVLAVGLQSERQGGVVCLFAVQGTRILRTIEIVDKITSCCFVGGAAICARSDLALFDGCLAVGTDTGKVMLVDLALKKCRDVLLRKRPTPTGGDSLFCMATVNYEEVKRQQKRAHAEGINFGVQLEGS